MRYFANYEADAVVRENDKGRRYIKRIENLNEVAVSKESREAWGIPSFGIWNRLEPITEEEYKSFGKKWDCDPKTGERRELYK